MKSPTNDAIMPANRPFFFAGSGVMPRAAIQGLANKGGEYQTAPRTHKITAETRTAKRLRWCRWCIGKTSIATGIEFRVGEATSRGRSPLWGMPETRVKRDLLDEDFLVPCSFGPLFRVYFRLRASSSSRVRGQSEPRRRERL